MRSPKEQIEWQKQAYGMTWEEVEYQVPEHCRQSPYDCNSVAISMLSDLQHEIEHDILSKEKMNQKINIIKKFIMLSGDKFTTALSELSGKDTEATYLEYRNKDIKPAKL